MSHGRTQIVSPLDLEHTLMLPRSSMDWLPENYLVFFLLDLAADSDLEAIHAVYRQKCLRIEKVYASRTLYSRKPMDLLAPKTASINTILLPRPVEYPEGNNNSCFDSSTPPHSSGKIHLLCLSDYANVHPVGAVYNVKWTISVSLN